MGNTNPTGILWIPINVMLENNKVIGMQKHVDAEGQESWTQAEVGVIKETATGKSLALNIFGTDVYVNKEAVAQLKSKKVGAIQSVSAVTLIHDSNAPTGVKSGIQRETAY